MCKEFILIKILKLHIKKTLLYAKPHFFKHRKLLKTIENLALVIDVIKHIYVVKSGSLKLSIAQNNNIKSIVYLF